MESDNSEIELVDLIRVVWNRRGLIAGGALLFSLLAFGWSLMTPKEYEAKLHLKIGQVWGEPIGDAVQVTALINSEGFLEEVRKDLQLPFSALQMKRQRMVYSLIADKVDTMRERIPLLIEIKTKGGSPGEAVKLGTRVANGIINEHRTNFNEVLSQHIKFEEEIVKQVGMIEKEIGQIQNTLKDISSNPQVNAPAVILLSAQIEEKQTRLLAAKREIHKIRINNSSSVLTSNTKVVSPPIPPEHPEKPRTALNVILGGVAGFIGFLILAFFIEFLKRSEKHPPA